MREFLVQELKASTDLQTLLQDSAGFRLWPAGALGAGDVPAKPKFPFLLYMELPNTIHRVVQETSKAVDRNFQIFAYDERGSYVRINEILELVRDTVLAMAARRSPSGAWCMAARWAGYSGDGIDPSLDANRKHVAFALTVDR